jgi:hypothetical protein
LRQFADLGNIFTPGCLIVIIPKIHRASRIFEDCHFSPLPTNSQVVLT